MELCTGHCVSIFVLGISNRHNQNMVSENGQVKCSILEWATLVCVMGDCAQGTV